MKAIQKVLHFILLLLCLVFQLTLVERLKLYYINVDLVMIAVAGITVFDG